EGPLVERPLGGADGGGGDGVVGDGVDEPRDALVVPLDRVHVQVVGEGTTFGVIVGSTDACIPGVAGPVNGAVDSTRLGTDVLHDVDLAGAGPRSRRKLLPQHPKRRPDPLAGGHLTPCPDTPDAG